MVHQVTCERAGVYKIKHLIGTAATGRAVYTAATGRAVYRAAFFPRERSNFDGPSVPVSIRNVDVRTLILQDGEGTSKEKQKQKQKLKSRVVAAVNPDYVILPEEVKRSWKVCHNNVVEMKNVFLAENTLWVVMPHMHFGSLRYIISSCFPNGMNEECILVALRETLLALSHIHLRGEFHKELTAGHIYMDDTPAIKVGFAATVYEHGAGLHAGESSSSSHAVTMSQWAAAPEIFNSANQYSNKADVWLFGVLALELAYGRFGDPSCSRHRKAFDAIVQQIVKKRKLAKNLEDYQVAEEQKKNKQSYLKRFFCAGPAKGQYKAFSKDFQKMVATCLAQDPDCRPNVSDLLQNDLFNNGKTVHYFQKVVMSRMKDLKLVSYVV